MKSILSFCAAIGVVFLASYLLVSNRKAAEFHRERQLLKNAWDAERAELEAALRAAKQRPLPVATASLPPVETVVERGSAQELLERLKKLKVPAGEQRNATIRRIIHDLESLADLGPASLPVIREFLGEFEDVDYTTEVRETDPDFGRGAAGLSSVDPTVLAGPAQRGPLKLDFVLAPSLRLGLFQVLKEIGGEGAEQVLAEVLSTSGRGVEVAYIARTLEEMVPAKYRDVAVAAAKDLLTNPPAIERPNRLDEGAKNYLYGVLSMYGDPSFASVAQNLLITQEGRIDRTTLNYLTTTLQEQAVPALYQAFNDNRITNVWERASLASQIFNYAGLNEQANAIFKEVVSNDTLPAWLRATAFQTLVGGRGPLFGGIAPTDPAQIQARIDLINGLPELSDEHLKRVRADAVQRLTDRLQAGPDQAETSFRKRLDRAQGDTGLPPSLPVAR